MGAPSYSIIRPKPSISNVSQITGDSKLCRIDNCENICQKISDVFTCISWKEEISDTGKRLVGSVQTDENSFTVSFEVEKIYIGEVETKWINIDPEGGLDVANEAKQLANALECVVLNWQTLTFLYP